PHSALISRHRRTPIKICRKLTAIATPIQPMLEASMREISSARLILRSEKYSSAAETSIFRVESRIRRISPLPGWEGGNNAAIWRRASNSPPWYGFRTAMAIAVPVSIAAALTARVKRRGKTSGLGDALQDMLSDRAISVTGTAGFVGFD